MSHDDFDWLPGDGLALTRDELEQILIDLRAIVRGTDTLEPNRAYALDVASTIARALDRGGDSS